MGAPPVPTSIKEARGTRRPDRGNPDEPTPPALELGTKPPSWLRGSRRRRAWGDLVELLRSQNVLSVLDALALAELVDAYGDYLIESDVVNGIACGLCGRPVKDRRPCSASVRDEDGVVSVLEHQPGDRYYTTRTKEGSLMIRPHPAMAARQDAWKRVVAMLIQFGMTPAAKTRVGTLATEGADPLDAFLGRVG